MEQPTVEMGLVTSRKKRLLWLTKGLGRGGTERLLADCLNELDSDRFDVQVAYLLPYKEALVEDIRSTGVLVHCLDAPRARDVKWLPALRSLVRDQDIDLVHTHAPVPAIGARLALVGLDAALVHTEHNMWPRYRWPTYVGNGMSFGRNDAVIAVSEAVRQSILDAPIPPRQLRPTVEVVRHGTKISSTDLTPAARDCARSLLGIPSEKRVLGTVANFTPKKNQQGLIRTFTTLAQDRDDLWLVLVGSGPEEAALRRAADNSGVGDRIVFTGMRDDVPALLPGFDVFVLSSLFEGLPISLVEAMASGVPCVATDVGGIPEVIEDGVSGLMVPAGDDDRLAEAVARVLDDPALRRNIRESGRRVADELDLSNAVRQTEQIYERVLAER